MLNTNLDILIVASLKAYLASGVEDQVDHQKFYFYSILTHFTASENDTVNPQLDTVNYPVSSQNDSANELKGGLKRIYRTITRQAFDLVVYVVDFC